MLENICILRNLLEVTHQVGETYLLLYRCWDTDRFMQGDKKLFLIFFIQVTFANVRRVTVHVRVISEKLSHSRAPGRYHLNQKTLNALIAVLSRSLQAAGNSDNSGETEHVLESHSQNDDIKNSLFNSCTQHSYSGVYKDKLEPTSAKQRMQLVSEILQTTTDLILVRKQTHAVIFLPFSISPSLILPSFSCYPEVHLVSWCLGAQSQQWFFGLIRQIPKPNLHNHQQWFKHLLPAALHDPASVCSTRTRGWETVFAKCADWAPSQPSSSPWKGGTLATWWYLMIKDLRHCSDFLFCFIAEWTSCGLESI